MSYVYDDQVRQDILRMIPSDGKVIASIGCGPAATEAELVRAGREVHGVDVAEAVREIAGPRLTSMRIIRPGEPVPFAENSLDGLILADVIEHIPRAWETLRGFAGLVKPGGWVVISVPNMRNLDAIITYAFRGDWPEEETGIFDGTHVQFMTHKRLERWVRQAGLVVEQWYPRPDPRHPRRTPILRVLNAALLGMLSHVMDFQIQVRCRRPVKASTGSGNGNG
jgi:2-polyprenyl-3-methyl-5-hydroxy-6-metoxy-1,4-benzoquinol methylase